MPYCNISHCHLFLSGGGGGEGGTGVCVYVCRGVGGWGGKRNIFSEHVPSHRDAKQTEPEDAERGLTFCACGPSVCADD